MTHVIVRSEGLYSPQIYIPKPTPQVDDISRLDLRVEPHGWVSALIKEASETCPVLHLVRAALFRQRTCCSWIMGFQSQDSEK